MVAEPGIHRISVTTLGDLLDLRAAELGEHLALVFPDHQVSYAGLAGRADFFARGLLAAFPGARLTRFGTRLLGLVLAGDSVEGGGSVIDREILDGLERVQCRVHLDVPGRGRVLEGEAVLVLPASDDR